MSKKSLENSKMSELVWSSQMMKQIIAPPGCAPSKGERIREAARQLQWKYSRAFSVWYADERVSLKPHELRKIEELTGVSYAHQAQAELRANDELIERATAFLDRSEPGGRRSFLASLRALVGALDRAGTQGD